MKIKAKYFTLDELTVTDTGLLNVPTIKEVNNLQALTDNVLEPLRVLYGKPIKVNSAFRSPRVNAAVKGSPSSDHLKGMAADITGGNKEENKKIFNLIKDNFKFKQLINESDYSWVHVSFDKSNLKQQILKL